MTQQNTQAEKAIGNSFDQNLARIAVGGYDDAQQLRKQQMNRVRDVVRKKREDIGFSEVEEEKEEPSFSDEYRDENLPDLIDEMLENNQLSEREHEYLQKMLEAGKTAEKVENQFGDVFDITEAEPIYKEWLSNVNGVSTTLAARLLHRFGYCEDFDRVSDLWSYCGLTPGSKREKGEQMSFDPQAKKVAWLVADCMMKMGDRSAYRREFFDPYKEKQLKRKDLAEDMTEGQLEKKNWTPPESQGHAHNRAMRYLAKKFLKHYWAISREIKGLKTPDEYIIAHGGHEKKTDTWENPFYAKKQLQGGV
jgi:hypothetical protein